MKIAFLTPEYPHQKTGSSGGIGTSIKSLAAGLLSQGHQARVLVYGQTEEDLFDDNGIIVQKIKNVKFKGLSWWLTRKKLEHLINSLFAQNEIDLIEAPDWTGITSLIQPEACPVVIRLNGSDTYFCHLDKRPVKWWNKFHEKRALIKANGLISVSNYTAQLTQKLFDIKDAFTVIPNGINSQQFMPNHHQVVPNRILYFGALIRKKGVLELPGVMNALYKLNPDTEMVLIGKDVPDILTNSLSTWALMQPLFDAEVLTRVHYMHSVSFAEIKSHIEQASVCVFPSFAEAFPLSWLEAMAMEKAIVASNIGWAQEQITDGHEGFLVDPKEHNLFAQKIDQLLRDKDLSAQFGSTARQKVLTHFTNEIIAEQSIEFYQKVRNNEV